MRRVRLYCDPTGLELKSGYVGELDARNTHYLKNVLRTRVGQPLALFDGNGNELQAQVSVVERRKVVVSIGETINRPYETESPLKISLGIGISKGERMDWVVQKATELGVYSIHPLFTERCDVKLDEQRLGKKIAHWQSVVVSACEQCDRSRLPSLAVPEDFSQFIAREADGVNLIFDPTGSPLRDLTNSLTPPNKVTLLVGPEGGFVPGEIEKAEQSGYNSCTFGPRILRTETAPVAGISVLQHLWGDC